MPIYKMNGKKDGRQQYRVRINYTDSNGKAHQIDRIAYGAAEAKDLERRLTAEIKEIKTGAARFTLQKLYDEYMTVKVHQVRQTSFEKVKQSLINYVLPILGKHRIDKLSTSVLQNWKTTIENNPLSVNSKKNIYRDFSAMLNWAVRMEYIPKNPLKNIGNFKDVYFKTETEPLQFYTPEQFKKYISTAKESCVSISDWGYYVFFNIAYYTGMRKGEINALKWSDIESDIIHVRRSVAQKIKGEDVETPPKNRSSIRDLQMPLPLINILNEHKERQKQSEYFTEEYRVCGGICCLRDTTLDVKNRTFSEKSELPRIRIHDFRHSHASLLANEGINIQEIARRLGHSDVQTTWQTYAHLYPREEERAVQILNKIM